MSDLGTVVDRAFDRAADGGPAALWTLLAVADAVGTDTDRRATRDATPGVRLRGRAATAVNRAATADRPLVEFDRTPGRADVETLVVDRWPALLAGDDRPGVAGDPTRPPLRDGVAAGVVSLGPLAAREPAATLLARGADVTASPGPVAVAAPTTPRVVLRGGGSVAVAGREVSWSVAAGQVRENRATVGVEYRTTEGATTTEATDHPTLRLYDRATLRTAAGDAGLEDVGVERAAKNWLVVTGLA